ncbi:MAG: hypothetical protein M1396_01890 [Chloroflexi bacterium]|nr:hypothetical protein [Chloroflexota bacterium]
MLSIRSVSALDKWLDTGKDKPHPSFVALANGISEDCGGVEVAPLSPRLNSTTGGGALIPLKPVEGRRSGRAKFVLLRQRVLATGGTQLNSSMLASVRPVWAAGLRQHTVISHEVRESPDSLRNAAYSLSPRFVQIIYTIMTAQEPRTGADFCRVGISRGWLASSFAAGRAPADWRRDLAVPLASWHGIIVHDVCTKPWLRQRLRTRLTPVARDRLHV